MFKYFSLILVSSLLSVVAYAQSVPTVKRNLNDYDKISVEAVGGENPAPTIAKVREFIWQHWTNRRLGYAEMTVHNKEGEPKRYFIFIESNESGNWLVSVRIEIELHDRRLIGDPQRTGEIVRKTNSYEAYIVEQTKPIKGRVSSASQTEQNNFRLTFKDQKGNLLTKL